MAEHGKPRSARQPRKRVLVVDDAAIIRGYLERLLGDAGFAVTTAMNGAEGLERALLDGPDLIVADLNMPQMDGLAMIRALRASEEARQMPVIVLSTEREEHDFVQAREAGANFFLVKPPEPEAIAALARLMSGSWGADA